MTWINVFHPANRAIYAKYFVDNMPEIYVLNSEWTTIGKNLKVNQVEEVTRHDQERRGAQNSIPADHYWQHRNVRHNWTGPDAGS